MANLGNYVKDLTFEGYIGGNSNAQGQTSEPYITDDFYKNYRSVTSELGKDVQKPKNGIDSETYSIMNRIKLPDYHSAMTTADDQAYWDLYNKDPEAAATKYDNDEMAFYQDNENYKLRAAQYLKEQPEEVREGLLHNFDISMTHAKQTLDDAIRADNKQKAKVAEQKLYNEFLDHLSTGDKLKYIIRGLSGEKENVSNELKTAFGHYKDRQGDGSTIDKIETSTGDNGVTTSTIYSTGPGDLEEFAKRMEEAGGKSRLLTKEEAAAEAAKESSEASTTPETQPIEEDVIEYTYKPGDTFGQVIKNLGLESGNGLWGNNGDVEYYTQQLEDQLWKSGIWPQGERQNIPVGTTIKLKRRPMTQAMIDYRNQYGYN